MTQSQEYFVIRRKSRNEELRYIGNGDKENVKTFD